MNSLVNRTHIFTLLIATMSILLFSSLASAEIYKWRNNRGVIQYSDKPPVAGFTKADRHEIVNSLQSKDLCAEPTAKTAMVASANKKLEANFFGGFNGGFGGFAGATAPKQAVAPAASIFARPAATTVARPAATTINSAARPVTNNYAPLNGATGFIGFGGSKVTVFGKPVNTAINVTLKPAVVTAPAAAPVPNPTIVATAPAASPVPLPTPILPSTTPPPSTEPNILQSALMPAVDINKNIAKVLGDDAIRITTRILANGSIDPRDIAPVGSGIGAFRIDCTPSHMSNDDPIVYPNQPGAAHHHTFFGNTSINAKTNIGTIASEGNSTCRGGIANRSAYWVPSMINTLDNSPLKPYSALWYYKVGYRVAKETVVAPPKGLRMIIGNMKSTGPQATRYPEFTCQMPRGSVSPPSSKNIPACPQGAVIVSHIAFPQCWDGKNLDSPDHHSHMEYASRAGCPSTHPIALPEITLNTKYSVTTNTGTQHWRLSSDNYKSAGYNAGYSSHADWINGWDTKVMADIVKNCLNRGVDCGNHMLGDGRIIYMGSKIPS